MGEYICPYCQNPTYDDDALLCHFCGQSLQRANKGFIGRLKYARPRVWWYVLVVLVLFCFVILFAR